MSMARARRMQALILAASPQEAAMDSASSLLSGPRFHRTDWVRRRCAAWALALLAALLGGAVHAQDRASLTPAEARAVIAKLEAHKAALARANAAVVGVETTAVEDARSNATLGRERQGSGILIGDDGLVLTIGYLILESDHVYL